MDLISNSEIWRFPRFFTDDNMTVSDADLRHAKQVLRIKSGDKVILCDGNGTDYICEYSAESDRFEVIKSMPNQAEPSVQIRLYQCLPKSDKMDFIVQKAVELGVSEIVPIVSKRCVSRPKNADKKTERWSRIAYEAAKQCGRGRVPKVFEILSFEEAVEGLNAEDLNIIFYECGGERLNDILLRRKSLDSLTAKSIHCIIGSEGGFEHEEIEFAEKHGALRATLGKRILRVDTASIAALSVIVNYFENE